MNIAVFGAKGRIGQRVVKLAQEKGYNVTQIDKEWLTNPTNAIDVVVDFSLPSAVGEVADFCKKHNCPLVCGVTGHNAQQLQTLTELSNTVTVVHKSNFSVGVEVMKRATEVIAGLLCHWDCNLVETHRKNKKDSPSGTALELGCIASQTHTFASVTIHSIRCGDNVGTHQLIWSGAGETLSLTHTATSADVFALGALAEAERLAKK